MGRFKELCEELCENICDLVEAVEPFEWEHIELFETIQNEIMRNNFEQIESFIFDVDNIDFWCDCGLELEFKRVAELINVLK